MSPKHDLLDRRAAATPGTSYLAEVVSVADPEKRCRVRVRLLSYDGVGEQDAPLWARVAAPVAGGRRGAFLLPDVGDEVLVTLVHGDPRQAVVIGGLWNGAAPAPETLGGAGDRIDRWTLVGKAGTRIAVVEERAGRETISLTTPGGVRAELTDSAGGRVELEAAGNTVTLDSSGVAIRSAGKVSIEAGQVEINSAQATLQAATWSCTGVGSCEVVRFSTVIATAYTPGTGNV